MPLVLLTSLRAYSQKVVLDKNGDTTICFSLAQSKFLLKQVYALQECDTLRKICEAQLTYCDTLVQTNKQLNTDIKLLLRNEVELKQLYDAKIFDLEIRLNNQIGRTKKQNFYKWCAIIGGGVLSSYLAVKYIQK